MGQQPLLCPGADRLEKHMTAVEAKRPTASCVRLRQALQQQAAAPTSALYALGTCS